MLNLFLIDVNNVLVCIYYILSINSHTLHIEFWVLFQYKMSIFLEITNFFHSHSSTRHKVRIVSRNSFTNSLQQTKTDPLTSCINGHFTSLKKKRRKEYWFNSSLTNMVVKHHVLQWHHCVYPFVRLISKCERNLNSNDSKMLSKQN